MQVNLPGEGETGKDSRGFGLVTASLIAKQLQLGGAPLLKRHSLNCGKPSVRGRARKGAAIAG